MLVFKTLEDIPVAQIVESLTWAFSDYFVKMPSDVDFWENRWKTNRIRYDLSIGVFFPNSSPTDDLIAFMVIGVDERNGKIVAFNAGTGVLPQYRGQKLVKRMYEFAMPIFKKNGVEELALEVITKNIKAIKAYQSVGFKVDKLYRCFRSNDLTTSIDVEYAVKEVIRPNWKRYEAFTKENYCWEYLINGISINLSNFRCFELYHDADELIAYYIINPSNKSIMRFEAINEISYQSLFHHWSKHFGSVRILNVQNTEKAMLLQYHNFENNIDQFEMICSFSS